MRHERVHPKPEVGFRAEALELVKGEVAAAAAAAPAGAPKAPDVRVRELRDAEFPGPAEPAVDE